MVALIICGSILLLIIILLALSLTVKLDYENGDFSFKIKYGFVTIIMSPNSPRRIKRQKKKALKKKRKAERKKAKEEKKRLKMQEKTPVAQSETPSSEVPAENNRQETAEKDKKEQKPPKKEKKKFNFDLDLIQRLYRRASPHIKRIFKKIRVYDVYIDFVAGGEDAAKVALNYGKMNAFVNGGLTILDAMILLEVKEVVIEADFDKEKSDCFAHAVVKLRLSTLLHSAIWGFFAVLSEMSRGRAPIAGHTGNPQTKGK